MAAFATAEKMMRTAEQLARPFAEARAERPATDESGDEHPAGALLVEADHRDARALPTRAPTRGRRPRMRERGGLRSASSAATLGPRPTARSDEDRQARGREDREHGLLRRPR